MIRRIVAVLCLLATSAVAQYNPSFTPGLPQDTVPFYPNGTYDPAFPKPNDFLQYPIGNWPLRYNELVTYLRAISNASPRVKVEMHAKSHEGRQLYNVFISSEANIRRLDEIRTLAQRLADPRKVTSEAELSQLVAKLPAVAWMGYSIHGDEISGVDAGMQLIYQLAAGTDAETKMLLDSVLIIVDPIENPDGRERYLSMLSTFKSSVPNYNISAMQHRGVWPGGRTNHYWFDMNRDWILAIHPETKGRLETFKTWQPHLAIDAHEQGSDDNFLMSPPREPVNQNTPDNVKKWWQRFRNDQSTAFDRRGWTYYVGEWHEQWYPGYGSAWPTFGGTIGILYEMAGVDGQFILQPSNYLLTYHEAVNKQFTSSIANLRTLATHRTEILRDYHSTRKEAISEGARSNGCYIIAGGQDRIRTATLVNSLLAQGIEVEKTAGEVTITNATDIYNQKVASKQLPAGSYVIPLAQPLSRLIKAALELDPRLSYQFLKEERRELEKFGSTRMYEVAAWSPLQGYGLEAYAAPKPSYAKADMNIAVMPGGVTDPQADYGFLINMEGEGTNRVLTALFQRGLVIAASTRPFTLGGRNYASGSLRLLRRGNPTDLQKHLEEVALEFGVTIHGIRTGASTSGSYLGAPTFVYLTPPRVALVMGDGMNANAVGWVWHMLDQELKIPHSLITLNDLAGGPDDDYNLIILTESFASFSQRLGSRGAGALRDWMSAGGTLITIGNATSWACDSSNNLTSLRRYDHVLEKLSDFDRALAREQHANAPSFDTIALWYPERVTAKTEKKSGAEYLKGDEAKEADQLAQSMGPRGSILRAKNDLDHWLTFGMSDAVPAITNTSDAFLAPSGVEVPVRFADRNTLRISGLLWPEGRTRWANSVFLAREGVGSGQIILFADEPNMRGYFWGTRQLLVNAILYGPGLGSFGHAPYEKDEHESDR